MAPAVPEHGQDSVHGQDLDHLVPVALADRVPEAQAEARHRQAKRPVRSVQRPAEAAVDVHSIRRPKKVQ